MTKEKVPPKVRKFVALTTEVWDTLLMIVIAPKISKCLYKKHEVTQTLKIVFPQLLKRKCTILMTSYLLLHLWNLCMIVIVIVMMSLLMNKDEFLRNLVVEYEKLIESYLKYHDILEAHKNKIDMLNVEKTNLLEKIRFLELDRHFFLEKNNALT